jgi:prolyl oligopeptidase
MPMQKHLVRGLRVVAWQVGLFVATAGWAGASDTPAAKNADDPWLWLEAIDDPKALDWVKAQNDRTAKSLAGTEYDALYRDALTVLDSASRVPEVTQRGGYLYNLWQDRDHPRGLYRRTTVTEFSQAEPKWETVLDIDALAKTEGKAWAFGGATWLPPENRRCLIRLAPGGGDAIELREFDAEKKEFVKEGFVLPTAKSRVAWRDENTLYVATDFGPGSLTKSGYPRTVKIWTRGTPLAEAVTLHTGAEASVSTQARRIRAKEGDIDLVSEELTFWTRKTYQIAGAGLQPLNLPATARVVGGFRGRLVVWLKEDWTTGGATYASGSVVLAEAGALRGGGTGQVELIVESSAHSIVKEVEPTPAGVLVAALDDVRGRLYRFTPGEKGWTRTAVAFPDNGALNIVTTDDDSGDAVVQFQSFLTPPSLFGVAAKAGNPVRLKSQAPAFDGSRFEVQQNWAVSADGTRIPYFVVMPKGLKLDGRAPTWMFSYGGFENALTPAYSGSYEQLHGAYGKLWLERGGVFVLANIRGGGEFGPAWHTAVLNENHYKCYEDFEAVARDLAAKKITSPAHLGIEGRSNGGLLVSATMIRHPELYGAVVCGNPLVDMKRYHKLLAGASWVAEYGDPDVPEQWAYISQYSPYQKVAAGQKLPPVIFYTSTRDDRVHPGHARKMAAKMESLGYAVDYYENTEGGHHGSVTNEQLATRLARTYAFLWSKLR